MDKILILPYRYQKSKDDIDYISEGIVEELMNWLSRSKDLNICSRSTSLFLSKHHLPPQELYKQYQIDYVIEGSYKVEESKIILTSRVFSTRTDQLLLTTNQPSPLKYWTQSVRDLAGQIRRVTNSTQPKPEDEILKTSQAKEYYLKGLYHWHRYTHKEMELAILAFKKSIKEDSNFALAYAAMADCYSIIGIMGFNTPKDAFEKANILLFKSLELNNTRSDTYVSAAFINIFSERNFPKANQNLERALTLNRNSVKANHTYAMYYIHLANFDLAEKHSAITIKEEPLAIPHYAMMIRILFYKKQFKRAIKIINQALKLDSESHVLLEYKGFYHLFSGEVEKAIDCFKLSLRYYPNNPMVLAHLSYTYSKAFFYEESSQVENQIKDLKTKENEGIIAYALALVKLGQNKYNAFFEYAEQAVTIGIGIFPVDLKCNPLFTEVQKDKRYTSIMHKCGLLDHSIFPFPNRRAIERCQLKTGTAEVFHCDPQDILYIKANDNYCTIFCYNNGILKNTLLRISLKSIEQQLQDYYYINRCHKSFIINTLHQVCLKGNKREAWLESKALPIRIPVSRSKIEFLKTTLDIP